MMIWNLNISLSGFGQPRVKARKYLKGSFAELFSIHPLQCNKNQNLSYTD